MTSLGHDRYCDEVVAQAGLLLDLVGDADLSATVPTTPDWTLAQLLRHVGGNLCAAETAVRTGTAIVEPEKQVPEAAGPPADDPAALGAWLTGAAARFADTLRAAGPGAEAQVWVFRRPTAFWARRAALDLVVHRADAAAAVGAGYSVAPDLAADSLDEFLELMSDPEIAASPPMVELRRPGNSIHLHATDAGAGVAAEWLIELGADGFSWRHAHEPATVTLRGPLAEVLRVLYRRLPPEDGRVEVLGDAGLLRFWLDRVVLN